MKELVTEIDIAASPSRVWQVVIDFEKHSEDMNKALKNRAEAM